MKPIDTQGKFVYNYVTGHVTGNTNRVCPLLEDFPLIPKPRVTIRDVAERAGVSHQTVSRVINSSDRVSPETQKKVEEAIAELGFQPNAIARFMAEGHTHTLACLAPNLTDFTFASIIEGAETTARQSGYYLISSSAPDEETFAFLVQQLISSRRTDGLLVINPYADQRHTLLPKNVPVVFLGGQPRQEKVAAVSLNDVEAGRLAARHLLELGHTQIATITGPLVEDCSQDRLSGFHSILHEAGINPDPSLELVGDWSATFGYRLAQQLLHTGSNFTAVVAQNDRMAVGAIRAFREAGLSIPGDISVVGCDDMPLASYFDPPLTTIHQDPCLIGAEAVRLLIEVLEKPDQEPQYLRLPARLIVRQSTASRNSHHEHTTGPDQN